jgi:hypothetical protein
MRRIVVLVLASLVAGCLAPRRAPVGGPHAVPATCAGAACHHEGWTLLRKGDAPAAAARFMMGCDSGDGPSCGDLAALYAAGRGVRRDDGRACELGHADACRRVGRPEPVEARTPTQALPPAAAVEARRASPVALEDALDWGRYYVKEEWREPLGFTREALEQVAPAPAPDQALARAALTHRMPAVQRCLPMLSAEHAWPARGFASLVLEPDGRVRVHGVVIDDHPGVEESIACAARAMDGWELPRPVAGGRLWLELEGRGREVRLPEPPPSPPLKGPVTKPRMQEPGCVARRVLLPADVSPPRSPVTVKFAVRGDGSVGRFEVLTPGLPLEAIRAIERAVLSCAFEPGTIAGAPAAIWVILPLSFRSLQ